MIRRIRDKLREIRYYSASRHHTAWHRASDAALWVSLLAALPMTWLSTHAFQRTAPPIVVNGKIGEQPDGTVVAWTLERDDQTRPAGRVVGTFAVATSERSMGWPFTTSLDPTAPDLSLDIPSEPQPRSGVRLAPDDPLRLAIVSALADGAPSRVHEAFREGDLPAKPLLRGWIANFTIWWVVLWAGSTSAVWVTAYLWRVRHGRHAMRRAIREAQGRCAHCGYDMRGLEFNERCPECGMQT